MQTSSSVGNSTVPATLAQLDMFQSGAAVNVETAIAAPAPPPKQPSQKKCGPAPSKKASKAPTIKHENPWRKLADPVEPTPPDPFGTVEVAETVEVVLPDLESVADDESPRTILAKRMFLRMMWDISGEPEQSEPDLFGQQAIHDNNAADRCRLDALIWMYSLNPDGSFISFEWVCDQLELDPDRIRRITGRSMRKELKRLVRLLATIVSYEHAKACEEALSDFADVSLWALN